MGGGVGPSGMQDSVELLLLKFSVVGFSRLCFEVDPPEIKEVGTDSEDNIDEEEREAIEEDISVES